jgi:hypothetical protein
MTGTRLWRTACDALTSVWGSHEIDVVPVRRVEAPVESCGLPARLAAGPRSPAHATEGT